MRSMRAIGLGIQSFEKTRKSGQFYVDKTALIGAWYRRNDDITLITRPRRFGKTLTIDMLHCFFSTEYAGRRDLFEGLAVSRDREISAPAVDLAVPLPQKARIHLYG